MTRAELDVRGSCGPRAKGTWWERKLPSAGSPSTSLGPVQPFGRAAARSSASAAGRHVFPSRARLVDLGDLIQHSVQRRSHRLVHRRGVGSPRRTRGA